MEEKKEAKNITIKFAIGIIIISIISQLINIFILGIALQVKANDIIVGRNNNSIIITFSILIQILTFFIMYYIMNKIILNNRKIKKENTSKIIRNIVIISIIIILINAIIIFGKDESIAIEYIISYTLAIILTLPIEKRMLNSKTEIDEEIKRKQNKIIIYSIIVLCTIIFVTIGMVAIKENGEKNKQIGMKIFLEQDISEIQKNNIEQSLKESECIESFEYISKEDALNQMKEKFKDKEYLLEGYEGKNNIFTASFNLKIKSKNVDKIKEIYENMNGVKKITSEEN